MNKERIFYVPDTLNPETANLVGLFAEALAFKLDAAQKKYGYINDWMRPEWMNICRAHLLQHLEKGDPRDVAAYCAFLWYHGESTAAPQPEPANAVSAEELTEAMIDAPRQFLLFYAGAHRAVRTAEMRRHLDLSGTDYSCWPLWAREGDRDITKAGAAILVWTMMQAAARTEQEGGEA